MRDCECPVEGHMLGCSMDRGALASLVRKDSSLPPCRDFETCGNVSDPRYTMDFTDVESGAFLYWCASCGPICHAMNDAIQANFDADPTFARKLEEEIEKVERLT